MLSILIYTLKVWILINQWKFRDFSKIIQILWVIYYKACPFIQCDELSFLA